MRKLLFAAALASLAAALAGCGPRGSTFFAPVVERPADGAWPYVAPPELTAQPPAVPKDTPQVAINTRFIAAIPSYFKKYGVDCQAPYTVISPEQSTQLIAGIKRTRHARLLSAPRLTAYAGQAASISVLGTYEYLGDYEARPGAPAGQPGLAPVMREVIEGMALSVRAEVKGDNIVLTALEPRMANNMAMRDCRTLIKGDKLAVIATWQEPITLVGKSALPEKVSIELKPGEAVAVPIHHTLRIVTASVRTLTKDPVVVLNAPQLGFLSSVDKERGYPLPGQVIALLTASRAPSGGDAPAPAKPKEP